MRRCFQNIFSNFITSYNIWILLPTSIYSGDFKPISLLKSLLYDNFRDCTVQSVLSRLYDWTLWTWIFIIDSPKELQITLSLHAAKPEVVADSKSRCYCNQDLSQLWASIKCYIFISCNMTWSVTITGYIFWILIELLWPNDNIGYYASLSTFHQVICVVAWLLPAHYLMQCSEIRLDMHLAIERHRYNVTTSLIGWAHT